MEISEIKIDKDKVAKKLRELRGNIPRKSLAKILGVGPSAIRNYENGLRTPEQNVKLRYALFFNVKVDDIFFKY